MIDTDPERVDWFDLPDECQHDHVVIYENPDPYQPPYHAVPFDYVGSSDTYGYYEEPEEYAITNAYREAVAKRASMSIEDVKLRQPPTVDPDEIEPL